MSLSVNLSKNSMRHLMVSVYLSTWTGWSNLYRLGSSQDMSTGRLFSAKKMVRLSVKQVTGDLSLDRLHDRSDWRAQTPARQIGTGSEFVRRTSSANFCATERQFQFVADFAKSKNQRSGEFAGSRDKAKTEFVLRENRRKWASNNEIVALFVARPKIGPESENARISQKRNKNKCAFKKRFGIAPRSEAPKAKRRKWRGFSRRKTVKVCKAAAVTRRYRFVTGIYVFAKNKNFVSRF